MEPNRKSDGSGHGTRGNTFSLRSNPIGGQAGSGQDYPQRLTPLAAVIFLAAQFLLKQAHSLWTWMESAGVVPYSNEGYTVFTDMAYNLLLVAACALLVKTYKNRTILYYAFVCALLFNVYDLIQIVINTNRYDSTVSELICMALAVMSSLALMAYKWYLSRRNKSKPVGFDIHTKNLHEK